MKINKLNVISLILLFIATISWGSSFIILKETISTVSTFYVLAIRFTLSAILLAIIFHKKLKNIKFKTVISGVVLGLILTFAYDIQTFGLAETSPARNAFLTGFYCILTPFIAWFLIRKKPTRYNVLAAFMCIIGIGLVVFSGSSDSGGTIIGDMLTLLASIFYALQIIFIDKYQDDGHDDIQLLIIELLTVGVINIVLSLVFDLKNGINVYSLNLEQFVKIMYLTLVCTLYAQFAMIFGQRHLSANQASLILSLESVFGALFSVIFGQENLTIGLIIGFVIIFASVSINEFKLDPFVLLDKRKE